MEKKKLILPSKKFFGAIDEDLNLKINLDESKNLLREGDRTILLDTSVLFSKERNESTYYKVHGKLKMVFRNLYSGSTGYQPLKKNLYLINDDGVNFNGYLPYNEFAFLRNDVKQEVNNPVSTSILSGFTQNIVVSGGTQHVEITQSNAPYHNWNICLSYVYSGDTNHQMKYTLTGNTVYSFKSQDGIPFRVKETKSTYIFTSPVNHGISKGEFIVISGGTLNSTVPLSGRTFSVISVGDENFNSENHVLEINKSEVPSGTTLSSVILGKRCINKNKLNETISEYYVHKHKVLSIGDGFVLDNIGFESSIWEDEKKLIFKNSVGETNNLVFRNKMESLIYDFKTPFSLNNLTNNLGFLPTDVYVSIIFKNKNGYFDYPYKVGYKFNFHDTWVDHHFSGNTSMETTVPYGSFIKSNITFISGNTITTGTTLTGGFIEYNKSELKERVVSEAFHKLTSPLDVFNHDQDDNSTYSGVSIDNKVGLYYQPHYKVKLRELSPYVETSITNEIYGLPQNAKYFENEGLWKWRDLYEHGFIDPDGNGTNYPFINNIHYVKNDINFYLRNEQQYRNKQDGMIKIKRFKC
jgi:hypothetical protein